MTLSRTFCSSPWFHMRITNSGNYEPCRWSAEIATQTLADRNIKTQQPLMYFQNGMAGLRTQLLNGDSPSVCASCQDMEAYKKVSGRQRQLLKVGVQQEYFDKSLASSPYRASFDHSATHLGHTNRTVRDWQIDLGNYCNSACVFCSPEFSSRLATEFQQLGFIKEPPPANWCDDPVLLDRFVQDLTQSTDLAYLHFIGGETIITPGFKKILSALVTAGIASTVTVGFTTNLTVWNQDIVDLLSQFQQVNLGMSIETVTAVNDYVRYPSKSSQVQSMLDRWVALGKQLDWLIQLRVTPTCLTVHELHTVYEYAWNNSIAVESCNFLDRPEHLRIGVLPSQFRQQTRDQLAQWVDSHAVDSSCQIVNTRDPNLVQAQIHQDAVSYLNYLDSAQDESYRLPELIAYLKQLESTRGNGILDYLPQYENLFRSHGY